MQRSTKSICWLPINGHPWTKYPPNHPHKYCVSKLTSNELIFRPWAKILSLLTLPSAREASHESQNSSEENLLKRQKLFLSLMAQNGTWVFTTYSNTVLCNIRGCVVYFAFGMELFPLDSWSYFEYRFKLPTTLSVSSLGSFGSWKSLDGGGSSRSVGVKFSWTIMRYIPVRLLCWKNSVEWSK